MFVRSAKLTPPLYCEMYDLLTRGGTVDHHHSHPKLDPKLDPKLVWTDLPGDAARLLELLSIALHADWGRSYDAARFPQEDIAALAAPPLYRVRAPGL
jgi:hypothetical protein